MRAALLLLLLNACGVSFTGGDQTQGSEAATTGATGGPGAGAGGQAGGSGLESGGSGGSGGSGLGSGGSGLGSGGEGGRPAKAWVLVETLTIDSNGSFAYSQPLSEGNSYRLVASGFIDLANGAVFGDADWFDFSNPKDTSPPENVDVGLAIDDPVVDLTLNPDWGPYNAQHVYETMYVGTGMPLEARYHDGAYGNNSGTMSLEIFTWQ